MCRCKYGHVCVCMCSVLFAVSVAGFISYIEACDLLFLFFHLEVK